MSELARRYAQALYLAAPDGAGLEETARALMDNAPLWQALVSPAVRSGEKERVLSRLDLLAGRPALLGFYHLLARKGRLDLLPDILSQFSRLSLSGRGASLCLLTCARAPDPDMLERLRQALCRRHNRQDIVFDIRVDPALLGGFILELDGVTYDKSVRGALEGLRRQMEERRMA